jgi:hypothetical protein
VAHAVYGNGVPLRLIATIVAAIVILNTNTSEIHQFEHVVRNNVGDQINGIRDLIDSATKK